MTETLRAALHERAELSTPAELDLDALVRRAERRVRRRRFAGAVAGAAAVALVAAGAFAVGGPGTDDGVQVLSGHGGEVSYATGSRLHLADRVVDVKRQVRLMVPTTTGAVFADPADRLWWLAGTDLETVGEAARFGEWRPRVGVAQDGRTVAWLEGDVDDLRLAVLDVTGDRWGGVSRADLGTVPDGVHPEVTAIDGDTVYVFDGTGLLAWTADGGARVLVQGPRSADSVVDVSAGRFLRKVDPDGADFGLTVSDTPTGQGTVVRQLGDGILSPDGRHWLTDDYDQFSVYDSATGARVDPRHPGFAFGAPYAWLDNDRLAALALETPDDDAAISLLVCRVSTGGCAVAARDIGQYGDVAIPTGTILGD